MPSGARQIKFPLTFPPIEAQPVRASAAGRIRSGEARMSSAPVAIDGKSAAALQPKEEQRFAAKCRAEDQHHADRQGFDQRKERSEEHTSELQSLMRISYAVFCLKKKNIHNKNKIYNNTKTTINNIIASREKKRTQQTQT